MAQATSIGSWDHIRFSPRRLAHGTFFVSDLKKSTAFYTEVCGLELVFEEPGIGAAFFSNGNTHHDVALVEVTSEERLGRDGQPQVHKGRGTEPGLNHLGFELATETELVAAYCRAKDAGQPIHRTADHQVAHSVYLFDPEGNYLELYADATREWRDVFEAANKGLITGKWDPEGAPASAEQNYDPDPVIATVAGAALQPVRTAHSTLFVKDMARALAFYTGVVGLDVRRADRDTAVLCGQLGNLDITLLRATENQSAGLGTFGLQLGNQGDLKKARDRLHAAQIPVVDETDTDGRHGIVIRDPDGLHLEFFTTTR